ncbi:multiple endocrine neoplasia I [Seminavis robusta]|uniref:Menin n=1 Tax=Seminavis robusta TaxID=568900 RepID=A0A9N8EGQ2_9STRA|nr:multiple endocrine neoplasia I [Seminavis robusta]|eukprot:Sro1137_g245280.1 multiple endocrine neoplasia I (642) ;mRNA; r:8720-10645
MASKGGDSSTPSSSSTNSTSKQKRQKRVRYDEPTAEPQASPHWQSLEHQPNDRLIHSLEELKSAFGADVKEANENATTVVAVWSTVCGYCEALTTHKDPSKRHGIYPVPLDALRRLVHTEFVPFCEQLQNDCQGQAHREAVRAVSNAIWKKAHGKSRDARDELHANSLYVCFRGAIDKRSLDCLGAAVVTIAALQIVLQDAPSTSFLTLSEDHAYESHCLTTTTTSQQQQEQEQLGTCEIALAGNTKDVQKTRGLDVADALKKANKNKTLPYTVTPENCWLYMRNHAVICRTIPMVLAALVGNINCSIVTRTSNTMTINTEYFASGPLMDLKREFLWILKDQGHLGSFPFATLELAECEDHRSTSRGLDWVDATGMGIKVMAVENLYLEAISVARNQYGDSQAYPYFCAGHYHKDSVWEETTTSNDTASSNNDGDPNGDNKTSFYQFDATQEYRLAEAVRLYSEATRVASQFVYDMQLMKQTTMTAMLIMNDVLSSNNQPRIWCFEDHAVATGTWLIAFYDSLMVWEERCGGKSFCEILTANHKYSIGKLFAQLSHLVRKRVLDRLFSEASSDGNNNLGQAMTENNLRFFSKPRSKRLVQGSSLLLALGKEKVTVRDMELVIPMPASEGGRRAKRARKSTR